MDWIKTALLDSQSERYVGWNKKKKCYDNSRRVVVVVVNYVVVIALTQPKKANFITAYLADSQNHDGSFSTLSKIRNSPIWE